MEEWSERYKAVRFEDGRKGPGSRNVGSNINWERQENGLFPLEAPERKAD